MKIPDQPVLLDKEVEVVVDTEEEILVVEVVIIVDTKETEVEVEEDKPLSLSPFLLVRRKGLYTHLVFLSLS
jgi:hypothetical protein